jgi:hypothetical protein
MYFNFTGLHPVFCEAIKRHEPTVAFPLANGRGRFLFLIFIPTDSDGKIKWSALELFVILSRTQAILKFDLMGQHYHQGDFRIRLSNDDVTAIRAELGLEEAALDGQAFDLARFLQVLNAAIPASLPLAQKIKAIQSEATMVKAHCGKFVDSALKVHLLGPRKLEHPKKPREETLRKLYALTASPDTIASLVKNLKALNWTVSWTEKAPVNVEGGFEKLWLKTIAALKDGMPR